MNHNILKLWGCSLVTKGQFNGILDTTNHNGNVVNFFALEGIQSFFYKHRVF